MSSAEPVRTKPEPTAGKVTLSTPDWASVAVAVTVKVPEPEGR